MNRRALALLALSGLVVVGVGFALSSKGRVGDERPADSVSGGVMPDGRRHQLAGIRTVPVRHESLSRTMRAAGIVKYDERRIADVNLKLEGWIQELFVNFTGQHVARGEPLFALYSPELVSTQIQLIAALRSREQLTPAQIAEAPAFADRLTDTPRQRLMRWDVPDDQIRRVESSREVIQGVVFRAPESGTVIEKSAVKGMHVQAGETLYRLADLDVVWLEAQFHEADVPHLRVGAAAQVTLDSRPGERLTGRVSQIDPVMDEVSRTVKIRIELENKDGRLKPGMFASVGVSTTPRDYLVVPTDSVVDSGTQQRVFVAEGEGHYEPRPVTLGERLDGFVEVLSGLRGGERVATGATFFLDSESRLQTAAEAYKGGPDEAPILPGAGDLRLGFQTTPNPPRMGENVMEVRLHDAGGRPITGADVSVGLSMPPMPSMNMGPMHDEVALTSVGEGRYRGTCRFPMRGHWDVAVTVARRGEPTSTVRTGIVAE